MKFYLLKLYWYINKLLDSYIKQQMMNTFSLVAFAQIRHFGSVIPNIFSIYIFVLPLTVNAYMTMLTQEPPTRMKRLSAGETIPVKSTDESVCIWAVVLHP